MIYYVIRHKASGELMPQAKKDRGYSHWNPSHLEHKFLSSLGVPRLIDTRRKATACIVQWAANPNVERYFINDWETGHSEEAGLRDKDDGRTKDDLEVLKINLQIWDDG